MCIHILIPNNQNEAESPTFGKSVNQELRIHEPTTRWFPTYFFGGRYFFSTEAMTT
jgi:hypothetical protein